MNKIYKSSHLKRKKYQASLGEQEEILKKLNSKSDFESERLKRYISLPSLTKDENSPLKQIVDLIIDLPSLKGFDLIDTPEIISSKVVFDLFNFPSDHPARSSSDTYYLDKDNILRPHTSLMWKYYFDIPEIREKLDKYGSVGAMSYGTCYRRDEVDWAHSNVFNQIDGLFVIKKDLRVIDQKDLENILVEIARSLYGNEFDYRFGIDHFPYTDPSLEMEIAWDDKWVEILGGGIVHPQVLRNLNIDPEIYNGWAFGFGLERLAILKMRIPDIRLFRSTDKRVLDQLKDLNNIYKPVSKYPPVNRDISFVVDKSFDLNHYYEAVRDIVGETHVEEVKLIDEYVNEEKFGKDKISYAFRITYRHLDKTLTNDEVDKMHDELERRTASDFKGEVR